MRHLFLSILLTNLMANPAHALSCVDPSPEEAFHDLDKSEKRYVPVVGSLSYLGPLPEITAEELEQPETTSVQAVFSGKLLSGRSIADFELEYVSECWAHWCGGYLDENRKYILFVEKRGPDDFLLTSSPCPVGNIWTNSFKTRRILKGCLAGTC